jgi:hypothetical protein
MVPTARSPKRNQLEQMFYYSAAGQRDWRGDKWLSSTSARCGTMTMHAVPSRPTLWRAAIQSVSASNTYTCLVCTSIALRRWQRRLVDANPRGLIRGLIQSDGCRVINRIRHRKRDGAPEYQYVRYFFTNASADIRQLFSDACALAGVDSRPTRERLISVARRDSVALLDSFVGPKF